MIKRGEAVTGRVEQPELRSQIIIKRSAVPNPINIIVDTHSHVIYASERDDVTSLSGICHSSHTMSADLKRDGLFFRGLGAPTVFQLHLHSIKRWFLQPRR